MTKGFIVGYTFSRERFESEVGEFVFENTSLSTDNELTPLSFIDH